MDIDVESLHNRRAVHRWNRMSVGDLFERVTYSFPDKTAIVGFARAKAYPEHERVTYREADAITNRIANALLAKGFDRSSRVMMMCENSVEAYLTKIACAKAGLVGMPINPAMAPDVVEHLIERCEPSMAIVDAEFAERVSGPLSNQGVPLAVTIPIGGDVVEGSIGFKEWIADAPDTEPDVEIHCDDIWDLLFTSGTTAMPKAVMLSHAYTYTVAYAHAVSYTRGPVAECQAVLMNFFPMIYHIGAHILPPPAFLVGGTFVLGRSYDPVEEAQAITQEKVTAGFIGAPPMVDALVGELEKPEFDGSSLDTISYGWAQISPRTMARYKAACGDHVRGVEIFGQTESIANHRFWIDVWPDKHAEHAPGSNYVGVPCPALASIIVDPATGGTEEVEPGVPGEALYRGPAVTAGYYRDPEATAEAFRDGWFHSGDSCIYDDDGIRIMVDRYKDIVKSGGENVSSLRVEAVINTHDAVMKSAVVGLPHERWGDAVTAFVIKQPGAEVTEEELLAHTREKLAGFERPKAYVFVDALPETVGGKVLKYKLREQHGAMYEGATT